MTTCEPAWSGGEDDEPLTLFAADSPASPSAVRASASRKPTHGGSGPRWRRSFADYDPGTRSWRTFQGSLFAEWETYSETWPRSGMTRNGIAYQRQPSAPLTAETECGSWPTPTATEREADAGSGRSVTCPGGRWGATEASAPDLTSGGGLAGRRGRRRARRTRRAARGATGETDFTREGSRAEAARRGGPLADAAFAERRAAQPQDLAAAGWRTPEPGERDSSGQPDGDWWAAEPDVGRVASRLSTGLDRDGGLDAHPALPHASAHSGPTRALSACEHCGSTSQLQRHHPDLQDAESVVILCQPCHAAEHVRLGTWGQGPKEAEDLRCLREGLRGLLAPRNKCCSRECLTELGRANARKRWDRVWTDCEDWQRRRAASSFSILGA